MNKIVQYESRTEKVRGLRRQITEFNHRIEEVISSADDEALVEVHSMLRREIAVGMISPHYAGLLDKLHGEIARRALNVIPPCTGEASA